MTREEEIAVAFYDYRDALKLSTFSDFEYIDIQGAFEEGAKWADNHPINVWNYVSEEPKEHSKIVIIDTKGEWWNIDYVSDYFDGCGLHGWDFVKVYYDIKNWAYTDDLLPKGGKK